MSTGSPSNVIRLNGRSAGKARRKKSRPKAGPQARPKTASAGAPAAASIKRPGADASPAGQPEEARDRAGAAPDSQRLAEHMSQAVDASRKLVAAYLEARKTPQQHFDSLFGDPLNLGGAFSKLIVSLAGDPMQLHRAHADLWQRYWSLWQYAVQRSLGQEPPPAIEPDNGDKRFRHEDWSNNLVFDVIKQSYLLTSQWLQDVVAKSPDLDDETRHKVEFFTKQATDAFSPSNFFWTNPEVLRTTIEERGENLVRGLNNVLADLVRGKGDLAIRQTDMEYFEVGRNLATTPGKVVFQNEILQLIQFEPMTAEVCKRPLLIFPPWINKYYILDLRSDNSFIRWCLERGLTVFIVSWVNPDSRLARKTFEDYMVEGIFTALDAVEAATGEREVNAIGYCIGGTLLSAALAYMAAKGDKRIASATFFAAQADFSEAGDLRVFIDDQQLRSIEERMNEAGGVLEGSKMANTFNMLRANDLIWSFVVNNYLLGKEPFRFDLLFWNADATRMPKALHLFYLREFYRNNKLARGELELCGEKLDLSKVKIPVFLQSSREDHIAPAKSVFKMTKLFGGPCEFIVAGSGHIAGVINPPSAQKYQHWIGKAGAGNLDDWWASAQERPGSWWPHWLEWLKPLSGAKVPARFPGDGKLKVIEDAPGSYVRQRS